MGATRLDVKLSADPFAYTVFAEFPLLAHRDKADVVFVRSRGRFYGYTA
jgi:hypothetical protein